MLKSLGWSLVRMDLDFDPEGVVLTAQAGGGASPPQAWASDKNHPRPEGAVHWPTIAVWAPVNGPYRAGVWLGCVPRPPAAMRRLRPGLLEPSLQDGRPTPFFPPVGTVLTNFRSNWRAHNGPVK